MNRKRIPSQGKGNLATKKVPQKSNVNIKKELPPQNKKSVSTKQIKKQEMSLALVLDSNLDFNYMALEICKKYFKTIHVISWDRSKEEKKKVRNALLTLEFDYLIAFWADYFLKTDEFKRAKNGAVNFHPSPLAHPGVGFFSFPFVHPEIRNFHGVTLHEIDAKLDNGKIYNSTKWSIMGMTPEEVCRCCIYDSLDLLEKACQKLYNEGNTQPTTCLLEKKFEKARWGSKYYSRKMELAWLRELPRFHIARRAGTYRCIEKTIELYFKPLREKWEKVLSETEWVLPKSRRQEEKKEVVVDGVVSVEESQQQKPKEEEKMK